MHHSLLIPEILQTICSHIDIDNYQWRGRDLLAMALVCRGFSKTFLDQLWLKIDSLYPLLTKMPPDIWSGPLARHHIELARAITPSDLEGFKAYANRVRFYYGSWAHDDELGRQMKSLLSQWSQLETLAVHHLPEESLRIVASLPRLRGLTLSDDYEDTFTPTPGTKVFPALQDLSIAANSPILCINLLKAAANCPLKTFTFELFRESSPPDWRDLFTALADSCDKGTLTTISISDAVHWRLEGQHGPNTADELRLLFPFTNLIDVSLDTRYGFDIDDAFVHEMAAAWPRLHALSIEALRVGQPLESQRLTLHGLVPLALLCPELRTLKVLVNAAHMCSSHFDLCPGSESCVDLLSVGRSPISEVSVPCIAAFLSVLFPKLRCVRANIYEDDCKAEELEYQVRWSKVQKHLVAVPPRNVSLMQFVARIGFYPWFVDLRT
ncbi:hypothetical protein BD779DRAFT_1470859 [Infundibulicybe gibba]|nr:hypothetical protein BD779DRAFT_1470859 [Infundibulicybe gibba]